MEWQARAGAAGHGTHGGTGIGAAHVVNINLPAAGPLAAPRSAYLAQVRRIAPPELVGRDDETAELAAFCLDEQRHPYVWWQAGPWAGKSALLSSFVLHPPERLRQRVQVVAFFVTARLAGQDTRAAFSAALTEQLAALTGEEPPAVLDEGLREAWLLDLLDQTAAACRDRGARLVLLVDGLDEDRSNTSGPGAHSIAGLLPGVPAAGMRVIVAGRSNPPVPDDVPDWHPLRDPRIVRPLADSPYAKDLERLGGAELKRLVRGDPLEQDVLGLLTAARGGLSSTDLRELTGSGLADIEDVLHTVAGRAFARDTAQAGPGDGPQVYLLGHEELHRAARTYLGESRLTGYRDRINAWADSYRAPVSGRPAWPDGTPEYLLWGYPGMLAGVGDLSRLVVLATDQGRHDRMLELTGADAAALDEIAMSQTKILTFAEPDLEAMALLSLHRSRLTARNTTIPAELPAVWALLERPARAEALAQSITDPYAKAQALIALAATVAAVGGRDRAGRLTVAAEVAAGEITDPARRASLSIALAGAVAVAGELDRAERIAESITNPYWREQAYTALVRPVAAAGELDRAVRIARRITAPDDRAEALVVLVEAMAAAGLPERARSLAGDAERAAHSGADPYWRAHALIALIGPLAATGEPERARELAADAERTARSVPAGNGGAQVLTALAGALAAVGEVDRAMRTVQQIAAPADRAEALIALVGRLTVGEAGRVRELAAEAERIVRAGAAPDDRIRCLIALARALAVAGELEWARGLVIDAERIARSMAVHDDRARSLIAVVEALAVAGETGRARRTIAAIDDLPLRSRAFVAMVTAMTAAGAGEQAEQIVESVTDQPVRAQAQLALATALAAAGAGARAERIIESIADPYWLAPPLIALVETIAATGEWDRAERMARSIIHPHDQAKAMVILAGVMGAAGEHDRAQLLTADTVRILRSVGDPYGEAQALITLVAATAAAGAHAEAEGMVRSIVNPDLEARALAALARALASAGEYDRAEQIAGSIHDQHVRAQAFVGLTAAMAATGEYDDAERVGAAITDPHWRVEAMAGLVEAAAAAGEHDRAERVARSIADPDGQARALVALAGAAAAETAARRLLCEALAVGAWWLPLPVIARVAPRVVFRIADEVFPGGS